MRTLIRWLDRTGRRISGIFEFCDDAACIFRLQWKRAPHDIRLSDGTSIRRGETVLYLHLWNEHIPPMGPEGPDLTWAVTLRRRLLLTLRQLARWVREGSYQNRVRAVGGALALLPEGEGGGKRLLERLGFEVFPYRGPWGRFGEFWENLYAWCLMWTYNPASVRHRPPHRLRRTEVWMSIQTLLERYG
ncbi:MAG TPA: hypothetical protein G4O00_09125 [Thermoflexia bacterium]|jgi:hypothetical protein|nr:hypothetical protein [Thermoflexia bacterium]